jgi:hypothetical protein
VISEAKVSLIKQLILLCASAPLNLFKKFLLHTLHQAGQQEQCEKIGQRHQDGGDISDIPYQF